MTLAEMRQAAIKEYEDSQLPSQSGLNRSSFAINDIVRISNGSRLIITAMNPNRPANCWSGIKERGSGKVYCFGVRHRPVRVGVAPENHPALLAMRGRQAVRGGTTHETTGMVEYKLVVNRLCDLILSGGDLEKAKVLAELVRELTPV